MNQIITRINLWSSPRNISTAMMYSFAQRDDTIVFDEPLYAHYLKVTGSDHPGKEEILQSQNNDGEKVIKEIILASHNKPVSFFKQMTHHLVDINLDFLSQTKNIIFIRDPKQIIASYAQVRNDVTMQDVGIEKQWQLYNHLTKNNLHCIVLDSNEILKSPQNVLQQLCSALQISFTEKMLHWPAGAKPYDGVWAKYWYNNVHQSTGFEKQKSSERDLPSYLEPLYQDCKKIYERLYPYSIKVQ
jgi:sulfotransferase family protein